MEKKRPLPVVVVKDGSEGDGVGRRQVLQGILAGVGAAIPGAALAHPAAAEASPAIAQAAGAKARAAAWKPEFLDAHQMATLQALCERIVPGSTGAHSDRFLDAVLAADRHERAQRFLSALGAIDAEATRRFGKPFKSVSEAQQVEILTAAARGKPSRPEWIWTPGTPVQPPEPDPSAATNLYDHFSHLKERIAGAYYSSEAGLKELGSTGQMFFASFPDCPHPDGHAG